MKIQQKQSILSTISTCVAIALLIFIFVYAFNYEAAERKGEERQPECTAVSDANIPTFTVQNLSFVETADSSDAAETQEDIDENVLLKIAQAEAESEGVEGKALVMLVVLNRVESDDFPDTIEGVVFQENQFSPVSEGGRYYTTEPDAECYEALELIRNGWNESQGALYFESGRKDGWHSRNLEFLFQHGNHKFYR